MHKIIYTLFSFCLFYPESVCFAASEVSDVFSNLPEISQNSNVHSLSSTYCRALWNKIKANDKAITNNKDAAFSEEFSGRFSKTVAEIGMLLENIKAKNPILVCDSLNLSSVLITDSALLNASSYFDYEAYPALVNALNSMRIMGKHKGSSDFDKETNAHVSEILIYVWNRIKLNPEYLSAFLIGLSDAAPTCIQGYSVRMLCAVHPPKLKTVAKK